jgi:hypothetical protein
MLPDLKPLLGVVGSGDFFSDVIMTLQALFDNRSGL